MTPGFCRYELRTTDAEAAREFYATLLGHDRAIVWPLHEQARARGAKPHWLGSIALDDLPHVERVCDEFGRRGAMMLGPIRASSNGGHAAVLRDPGGAIVGVVTRSEADCARTVDVVWHVLNTNDLAAAKANYRELFGWTIEDTPMPGPSGAFHSFRWDADPQSFVGMMGDIVDRPDVHPHWLFFFEVESVDAALEWIRSAGGTASDPIETPTGERILICEDPQGAAFGVTQLRR